MLDPLQRAWACTLLLGCGCVCVRTRESQTQRYMFVWGRIPSFPGESGLGLLVACASTESPLLFATTHSSNQAACQTNRWSQQRDVFSCLLRQMQQMQHWHQRLTQCDIVWQPTVSTQSAPLWLILKEEGGSGGWHCAHDQTQDNVCQQQQQCHFERETKTDSGGWFHGAVMLHAQSPKDFHMWGESLAFREVQALICSLHDSIFGVNCGHYTLQGQNPIT